MKKFLIFAAALSLALPAVAAAQPGRPDNGHRPGQGDNGRPGGNNGRPSPGGNNGRPTPLPQPVRPNPGGPNRPGPGKPDRPVTLPKPVPGRPGVRPPPRPNPPAFRPPSRPPQFSWRGRSFNRYRGPAFHYPRGYSYRRWSTGALLPSLFLSTSYFFDNWRTLGIGAPPPGRRWVRYGPDLLLVNVRTRRVEDTIYGAFY
jgi:Ni/Co efflux regulator RcnB